MAIKFVNTITYNTSETIIINGATVTLTGTTAQNAVDDINASLITDVLASNNDGIITLYSNIVNITILEGNGTALSDMGFTAGVTILSPIGDLSKAINDIMVAGITGITASNVGGALSLTSTVNNLALSGTGLIPFGLNSGTLNRQSTVNNAINGINAAAVSNINVANVGGALNISSFGSSSVDIIISEGSGSTLTDLGFIAGTTNRTSTVDDAVSDLIVLALPDLNISKTLLNELSINSAIVDITLTEGTGSTLSDLGLIAGSHLRSSAVGDAITDINIQTGPEITAVDDGDGRIKIIMNGTIAQPNPTMILTEGTGTTLTDLGLIAVSRTALPDVTSMNDVTDVVSFFTELIHIDIDINAVDGSPLEQDLRRNDDVLNANFNNHVGESYTITQKGSSVRTVPWSAVIIHEFSLTFNNDDETRAFFNTGGQLRLDAIRTGGTATPQNTAWDSLLLSTPSPFTGTDYFTLTTIYQPFFVIEDVSGGPYDIQPAPIKWSIFAKTNAVGGINGGNGNVITFQVQFLDQHLPLGAGPDTVDGTFTSIISEKRSTGVFVKPSPIYTPITELSAGI